MHKHYLSIDDISTVKLFELITLADTLKNHGPRRSLIGKTLTNLFYEPSTRTSSSFHAAMTNQGGNVIQINNVEYSSVAKGENIEDTVRTLSIYSDVIVLRTQQEGDALKAAKVSQVPIINAGDGKGEHPTQTLLDAYTIYKQFGSLAGLNVGFMGDLKNGRTVHSLYKLLKRFEGSQFYEICPEERSYSSDLERFDKLEDIADNLDVLYMTRLQKERGTEEDPDYVLTAKNVRDLDGIVMHPFPRNNEIPKWFDKDGRGRYFEQIENGLYMRMALLKDIFTN